MQPQPPAESGSCPLRRCVVASRPAERQALVAVGEVGMWIPAKLLAQGSTVARVRGRRGLAAAPIPRRQRGEQPVRRPLLHARCEQVAAGGQGRQLQGATTGSVGGQTQGRPPRSGLPAGLGSPLCEGLARALRTTGSRRFHRTRSQVAPLRRCGPSQATGVGDLPCRGACLRLTTAGMGSRHR